MSEERAAQLTVAMIEARSLLRRIASNYDEAIKPYRAVVAAIAEKDHQGNRVAAGISLALELDRNGANGLWAIAAAVEEAEAAR